MISTANANITSPELADRLRKEYHLEMEMTGGTYVLAMTTVADTQEGLNRLKAVFYTAGGSRPGRRRRSRRDSVERK